ncbi:MAG: hypothetical protein JO332_08360 [Planctomycetaceae bacterium]|nr:hypothetical protein [Planctomycetaceae bacterium]
MTLLLIALISLSAQDPGDRVLFDFEEPSEAARWSNLRIADPETADRRIQKEPPATWERSTENATSGAHSLKITFHGGRWPTITTPLPAEDWTKYQQLVADVTVSRPCLVGFTVMQEKSSRKEGWAPVISRWTKTLFAQPGRNLLSEPLHRNDWQAILPKFGPVVAFEIFLYHPHDGESLWVDNVRLLAKKEKEVEPRREFRVAGTDWTVSGVSELGKKLKDRWTPPVPKTVDEVEADFRVLYEALKATHPKALLATFRDGENGYAGWTDAYFNSHGPDSMTFERSENGGKRPTDELFMRHRSPLHRVDLSSIPTGSAILAARLLICRAGDPPDAEHDPQTHPTMWAVEPCNRPWVETEVNAYEYAKDKFWKAIGGQYYGDDPDFLPLYLSYGPGLGKVNVWDFTEAVRFWTDGRHENHGFMLHGDGRDWMGRGCYREYPEVRLRPAVLVVYDPQ